MLLWTHRGPPPGVGHRGEVGVVDVVLHAVNHGWKHEDPHADEEQQTANLQKHRPHIDTNSSTGL